jgi:hypothetical protein
MNWTFIAGACCYGALSALWQTGSSIYILDAMPSQWGWIKIASAAVVAFVGGIFLYTRNPSGAWQIGPGGK